MDEFYITGSVIPATLHYMINEHAPLTCIDPTQSEQINSKTTQETLGRNVQLNAKQEPVLNFWIGAPSIEHLAKKLTDLYLETVKSLTWKDFNLREKFDFKLQVMKKNI